MGYQRILFIQLLQQEFCEVNESTFRSLQEDLEIGMGLESYSSSRYDGTAIHKKQGKITNAYERLRYISLALEILKTNNGRFPYIDESVGSLQVSLELGTR